MKLEPVTETVMAPTEKVVGAKVTLTFEEIALLRMLCDNIGGHPDDTVRGVLDDIREKLGNRIPASNPFGRNVYPMLQVARHSYPFTDVVDAVREELEQ